MKEQSDKFMESVYASMEKTAMRPAATGPMGAVKRNIVSRVARAGANRVRNSANSLRARMATRGGLRGAGRWVGSNKGKAALLGAGAAAAGYGGYKLIQKLRAKRKMKEMSK